MPYRSLNLRLKDTLRKEAIVDPLTGLYNRRHMEASLKRESRRVQRHNSSLGFMMLDVDHFKLLNDTYTHEGRRHVVLRELGTAAATSHSRRRYCLPLWRRRISADFA